MNRVIRLAHTTWKFTCCAASTTSTSTVQTKTNRGRFVKINAYKLYVFPHLFHFQNDKVAMAGLMVSFGGAAVVSSSGGCCCVAAAAAAAAAKTADGVGTPRHRSAKAINAGVVVDDRRSMVRLLLRAGVLLLLLVVDDEAVSNPMDRFREVAEAGRCCLISKGKGGPILPPREEDLRMALVFKLL